MDMRTDDLISRREAAQRADVHINTIRLWEDAGRLHAIKQENGRVLIRSSELGIVSQSRGPFGALGSCHEEPVSLSPAIPSRPLIHRLREALDAVGHPLLHHLEVLHSLLQLLELLSLLICHPILSESCVSSSFGHGLGVCSRARKVEVHPVPDRGPKPEEAIFLEQGR